MNPRHLRWATVAGNHADALAAGTHSGLRNRGESHPLAKLTWALVREIRGHGSPFKAPVALLSGGECTVTVTGNGAGGPNQEYALGLAIALGGSLGISALAADTDGIDGGGGSATDPAGAVVSPDTLARAQQLALNPATILANNDSTAFFAALGDLVRCGPTQTNVNDFRAILVDP